MTHTPITTYNTGYSQLTQFEGITFVGGGVLSDNQGVTLKIDNYNIGRDTEAAGFSGKRYVNTNTNITI